MTAALTCLPAAGCTARAAAHEARVQRWTAPHRERRRRGESHPIRCSHFDAFRFSTPDAAGLDRLQPARHAQVAMEQPGCLHATMDLYTDSACI